MPAVQAIWGNRNVQITNVSDSSISIALYDQPPMLVPLAPAGITLDASVSASSPAMLVRARFGVVPFMDHTGLLDRLVSWCHSPGAFAMRFVAGPAGVGKTRLAVRVCEQVSELNWLTGLLTTSAGDDRGPIDTLVTAPTSRLIVVDYAETRPEQLAELVPLLVFHSRRETPVRVLLTARGRSVDGNWTCEFWGRSDAFDVMLAQAPVDVLSERPLGIDSRRVLCMSANRAFVHHLNRSGSALIPIKAPPAELAEEVFSNPLMVVIAAYLAIELNDHLPSNGPDLIEALLLHEDHYWERMAKSEAVSVDLTQRRRLVALSALAGADSEVEGAGLLSLITEFADPAATERRHQMARLVHRIYRGERYWNLIEPDLVAEHLVAETFGDDPKLLTGVLHGRSSQSLVQPVRLLARAAADHPTLAHTLKTVMDIELPDLCRSAIAQTSAETHLDRLLGASMLPAAIASLVQIVPPDPGTLQEVLDSFPTEVGLVLRPLVVILQENLTSYRRWLAESDPDTHLYGLASALHNLAIHLIEVGRREEGLTAVRQAVELLRRLAEDDPIVYLFYLAESLGAQTLSLGKVGRPDEALASSQEAVDILRRLAEAHPVVHDASLAIALNNWSHYLGEVGRPDEGLTAVREAVEILRRLAENDPATHAATLAASLNNLSIRLEEVGLTHEALTTIQEAVTLRRIQAESNPGAYLPDLAMCLNNMSIQLLGLQRRREALISIREAVNVYRILAKANAAAYLPDLATPLHNMSNLLAEMGRPNESLTSIQEAVEIRRSLAESNPQAHLADLAASLHNMSIRLREAGRHHEDTTMTSIQEAVEIRRSLAESNPQAHLADLAASMNTLSVRLGEVGRRDEALATLQNAVNAYRALGGATLAANQPGLADSLNNLSIRLEESGRRDLGLVAIREAVEIRRRLAESNPAAAAADLATSLRNYSGQLARDGQPVQAKRASREADDVMAKGRNRTKKYPAVYLSGPGRLV